MDGGKSPGRRQCEFYSDIREARRGVEVDHRLPYPYLLIELDGVPIDNAIIGKGQLGVQRQTLEGKRAIRCRIAVLGVEEIVDAGDLLP